jgi:hypothetical protein
LNPLRIHTAVRSIPKGILPFLYSSLSAATARDIVRSRRAETCLR